MKGTVDFKSHLHFLIIRVHWNFALHPLSKKSLALHFGFVASNFHFERNNT